jgi:hypothetical protein
MSSAWAGGTDAIIERMDKMTMSVSLKTKDNKEMLRQTAL